MANIRLASAPESATPAAPAEFSPPHPWQVQPWARFVRALWRHRAYTRWVDQYCTSLEIRGLEHVESLKGPAIFTPNHQSHMDTLVLHEAVPDHIRRRLYFGAAADRWYVKGKKKLILQPWYQSLILGNFPIVRGGGSKTLDYARWLLRQGKCVCIFPEGTRAMGESLGRFRHGVSIVAIEEGVPIVPVYLSGLKAIRPKGTREYVPGAAGVEFLAPLTFDRKTDVEDATRRLWSAMNTRHVAELMASGQEARAA